MREKPYRVTAVSGQIYDAPDGAALRADLYLPQNAGGPLPVIIWVHGGGWRFGNRHVAPDLSRFFAECGFAMVAADYRLSDRSTFPAQIEDLRTAIRWVRSVAVSYGLDAERIGLWGASAGGHLATLAALCDEGLFKPDASRYADQSSNVQAVVTGYAPLDFLQLDADRPPEGVVSTDPENLRLPSGMRSVDAHSFESLLLGAPIATCPDRVRAANPITYARPGSPPFLILHGLSDTTVGAPQSELLYDALAADDNLVTLCLIEGLGHGFLNRSHLDEGPARSMRIRTHRRGGDHEQRVAQPIFPMIEAFFRRHLARRER